MTRNRIFVFFTFGLIGLTLAGCSLSSVQTTPTTTTVSAPQTSPPPELIEPTEPATLEPTPIQVVRFAVIGDYGEAGPDLQAVAEMIDSWQVDFIITTGDNNYPDGAPHTIDENIGQYFHSYIYPYKGAYGEGAEINRFFPSLGNHDWRWLDAQPYLDYFTLPGNERYYDFEWDFVHLFALDSDSDEPDGNRPNSDQADWLRNELNVSTAPWKIVYFHHSPYSSGHHGPYEPMQWDFKEWGADLVISGHDHIYERLEVEGLTYLVQGISGASRYSIVAPYPGSQVRFREEFGALLVIVSPNQLDFAFYTTEGEIIDQYSLSKSKS